MITIFARLHIPVAVRGTVIYAMNTNSTYNSLLLPVEHKAPLLLLCVPFLDARLIGFPLIGVHLIDVHLIGVN